MGNNPSKPAGGSSSSASPAAASLNKHHSHPQSSSHSHSQSHSRSYSHSQPRDQQDAAQAPSAPKTTLNANDLLSSTRSPPHKPLPLPLPTNKQQPPDPHSPNHPHPHFHDDAMGNEQSRQVWKDKQEARKRELEQEQSSPVRVPQPAGTRRQKGPDSQFAPSGLPRDPNYIPHSNLNFPPRLPLPIEEEIHTPGSPIVSPADLSSAVLEDDVEGALPRVLSSTTIDDDDVGDELQGYGADSTKGRTVPTLVEWKQGGDKIYVTGTFASWSRKYRMHRHPDTNVLSTVIDLPPGTHHVKFIVDGEMQLSNELPTAVDYTNILVNYIEVSADDLPRDPVTPSKVPEGVYPPQVIPPGVEAQDHAPDSMGKTQATEDVQATKPIHYGDILPEYLVDLDRDESSRRFQLAAAGVSEIPMPPSLPLFLGKSILNGTMPMKDDSSVLNMPNHTVLNHLATSSIKNDVLATSSTTRYKRKYVTTIMYRPTDGDED